MKKIFILTSILVLFFNTSFSQKLSHFAEISIITCGPGSELYSTFGHSAIRVYDSASRIDKVYNYGTFDFETKGFYTKFIRGQLDYMLSVAIGRYFFISYVNENRWIKQQNLNLTAIQKEKLFKFLENNAKPENKFYRYDFFYDNCATRVKDVFKISLGNDLIIGKPKKDTTLSFKNMITPYINNSKWIKFGIYLGLGHPSDKIVSPEQASFIPDFLYDIIHNSKVIIENDTLPLVKEEIDVFVPKKEIKKEQKKPFFTPILIFWIIFGIIVVISTFEFYTKKYYGKTDNILFFFLGIIGLTIVFLWFGTDHKSVVNNLNIIWANPLYIFAIFLFHKEKYKKSVKIFFLTTGIISLLALFPKPIFPQEIHPAFIPIILSGSLRAVSFYFRKD